MQNKLKAQSLLHFCEIAAVDYEITSSLIGQTIGVLVPAILISALFFITPGCVELAGKFVLLWSSLAWKVGLQTMDISTWSARQITRAHK